MAVLVQLTSVFTVVILSLVVFAATWLIVMRKKQSSMSTYL